MTEAFTLARSTRRAVALRRSLGAAALVVGGVALAAGCSSDDTTSTTEASSTEVTAEPAGTEATIGDLEISDARIGEPAGATAGLYLSVTNNGDAPDTLTAISTKVSPEVQLHETVTDGNRTSMQELSAGVEVPAGKTVTLEPGGLHAMLLKVDPLTVDERVPVTLSFDTAGDLDLDVTVVPLTELGGGDMGHDSMDDDGMNHNDMDHADMDHADTDHADMGHGDSDDGDADQGQ